MTEQTGIPIPSLQRRTITQLSMELIDVPPEEQCFIFEQFEAAIRKGTINAVQDSSGTFEAEYIGSDGETVKRSCPEEHVEVTEAWKKWLAEQRSASRYHVMKVTRTFVSTQDLLHKNDTEFDTLARLRRQSL